jgi:pescadillo protein
MAKEVSREKGKTKHKKTGAKSIQKFSSKRRLSRFGKERKKGEAGLASAFISRTQILKRLQITLKDFRRLCILKGIYPREPRRHLKGGKEKTYYHFKDVAHLSHEPLINKFREFKAFMKKVRKSLGRREFAQAKSLYQEAPTYTLHHIVKERYPKFEDAVRDLDDALNLVHLFAALPATGRVTNDRTAVCRELIAQFQFYVIKARNLNKCFVSVKGIYFQATILGIPVTWINPHEYTQHMPKDVDYRTMLTFLEFYETLLKFSLFKLYHNLGLQYPPALGDAEYEKTGRLMAIKAAALDEANKEKSDENDDDETAGKEEDDDDETTQGAQKQSSKEAAKRAKQVRKNLASMTKNKGAAEEDDEEEEEEDDDEGSDRLNSKLSRAEVNRQIEAALQSATETSSSSLGGISSGVTDEEGTTPLFKGLCFFLSRESQYAWLEFTILACGGSVGWQGSSISVDDECITHVIYDRPIAPQLKRGDVEYVQPQWLLDSMNNQFLLPMERYRPGVALPPHLSPFVDDEKEGYVPAYRTELLSLKSAAEEYGNVSQGPQTLKDEEEDNDDDEDDDDEEEEDEEDEEEEEQEDEEQEEEEDSSKPKITEEKALALTMMKGKAKHLYDRMQYGINKKSEKVEKLKKKRALTEEDSEEAPKKNPSTLIKNGGKSNKKSKK